MIKMKPLSQSSTAKQINGHSLMHHSRFAENTRHMIIFDVLSWDCPVDDKGERFRLFYKQS
jgi:hypothetical protein